MPHFSDKLPHASPRDPPSRRARYWVGLGFGLVWLLGDSIMQAQAGDLWVGPRIHNPTNTTTATPQLNRTLRSGAWRLAAHRHIDLSSPSDQEIRDAMGQDNKVPLKIGFNRPISAFGTKGQTQAELDWQAVADGGMTSLVTFTSPGAAALRLGIQIDRLPPNAELRFFAGSVQEGQAVAASAILTAIEKNLAAGDPETLARRYWSPVVVGDSIGLEIYLPPGVPPESVEIAIPSLSHVLLVPDGSQPQAGAVALGALASSGVGASGSCNNDVSCEPSWLNDSNAVARMVYSDGTNSYLCSGTLLNDSTNSGTPYFLTANHCISTQTAASSLNTFWFFRSTHCNSGQLNPQSQILPTGATLLYHSTTTDTSFLQLNSSPPAGVMFAGWTTAAPSRNDPASGIHHPRGDLQKISFGAVSGFFSCTAPAANGQFTCSTANASTANFFNITYTSGVTEPGSSGSGVFLNNGQHVFGQLYGGDAACSHQSGTNYYGRFDQAYRQGNLGQWLSPPPPSYSLVVTKTGSGKVTSNPQGIDCGATCSADFAVSSHVTLSAVPGNGYVFGGWGGACAGSDACVVTMTGNESVTAQFSPATTFAVKVKHAAHGVVTSTPGGIDCGGPNWLCSASFASATLTATPDAGYVLKQWQGCPSPTANTCTLTPTAPTTLKAVFAKLPKYPLTVLKTKFGAVVSQPAGLRCRNNAKRCWAKFVSGTVVVLSQTPQPGRTFLGWSGACLGTGTCSLTMKGASRVQATFQ